jgi:hypothetical protein
MEANDYFLKFAKNVFSQAGDDGVIEAILNYFSIDSGVCCEFGASDGLGNANTANLWKNKSSNWKALLIEPKVEVIVDLIENTKKYENVRTSFVAINRQNIDKIISENLPDGEFVLLSIDIDGDDVGVFAAMTLEPKIVIIESSDTHESVNQIIDVAKNKGYVAVASTGNVYLVHSSMNKIREIPKIDENSLVLGSVKINELHNLPRIGY